MSLAKRKDTLQMNNTIGRRQNISDVYNRINL